MNSFSRHSGVFARNSATSTRTESINTPDSPGGLGVASPSHLATAHLYDNEKTPSGPFSMSGFGARGTESVARGALKVSGRRARLGY